MKRITLTLAVFAVTMLPVSLLSAADTEVRAYSGKPFGVGKITVRIPPDPKAQSQSAPKAESQPADFERSETIVRIERDPAVTLTEKNGRALYPAVAESSSSDEKTPTREIYFLFVGEKELEFTVPAAVTAKPVEDEINRRALLEEWWDKYLHGLTEAVQKDHYPPIVENYLTSMLSRRLNLKMGEKPYAWSHEGVEEFVGLFTGAESVRLAMQRDTLLQDTKAAEKPDKPLPRPATLPAVETPEPAAGVAIEPIAMHVPVECFYVRLGSFANFQWLREKLDELGASGRNLVAMRGLDYGVKERLERQLVLKETALAKLLGGQVIADVAVIGTDGFIREGAALGLLFQAKNSKLLSAQIANQRKAVAGNSGVTEETVDIAGHRVSLVSTLDNSVRSFYAVDGDYHLVTTSKRIVQRFYEAGLGQDSLASAREFRYARTHMPLSQNDTAFVYLSDAFFRNIVGPQYRVEMTRRMKSLADMQLVQMARLAAKAEGVKVVAVEDLVEQGFLPESINIRPDGSKLALRRSGQVIDSLRGAIGSFTPVCDVEIPGVTDSEAKAYEQFREDYNNAWTRMDPVMVAVKRQPGSAVAETITFDVHITPYAKSHYGILLTGLGNPSTVAVVVPEGDLLSVQVVVRKETAMVLDSDSRKGLKGLVKGVQPSPRVFGGIRDFEFPWRIVPGGLAITDKNLEKKARVYVGEWPSLNLFKQVTNEQFWAEPDEKGYCKKSDAGGRLLGDLEIIGRKEGRFAMLSLQRELIDKIFPALDTRDTPRPAQIRFAMGSLSGTKLGSLANAAGYLHAMKVSDGMAQFLDTLTQQLRVPHDEVVATAESMLAAKLACPLGGTYRWDQAAGRWVSSANPGADPAAITAKLADYQFPLLELVKGLRLEFALGQEVLTTHIELDLAEKKENAKILETHRRGRNFANVK